jgi:pimeloyl-ACP methyl ester carboxylesterase
MSRVHFIRALSAAGCAAVLCGGPVARAQTAAEPASPAGTGTYRIFLHAVQIGTMDLRVSRDADGWTIVSSERMSPPLELLTRTVEIRYDGRWRPREVTVDATLGGHPVTIHTVVEGANVTTQINDAGQTSAATEPIDDTAIFLPNPFFAAFSALAVRLQTSGQDAIVPIYSGPHGSYNARVGTSSTERIQTASDLIDARRTDLQLLVPGAPPLDAEVWADPAGHLLRVSVPAQGLEVVRDDVGSVAARRVVVSRPNDETVRVPANGFTLAGTISKPVDATPTAKLPAVVLVGGSGPADRDEMLYDVPIFGQLAGSLADAGFLVLRYDKRGVGQSGGRPESATLADYADDLRAAVKFVADRKDVDDKRIAVVGHSEGGSIAMIAADKEKKIAALVLVGTMGVTGAELNLAQIKHVAERTGRSEADTQATLDLQKKIQQAVETGKGWDDIDPQLRQQADTPWFRSFLTFDPRQIMKGIDQPILIVQGDRDTQVEPSNADQLAELARARKKAPPPELVEIPGINHLLVPADTGEVDEYARLKDTTISPEVAKAIIDWLRTTLPPKR